MKNLKRFHITGTAIGFIKKNPLLANSVNLILAVGVSALFGFVFWIVVAHNFNSQTVGLATTLLAMSTLLSLLGLAGFDTVFMRFLAKSKQQSEQISTGMIISGIASIVIAIIFCLITPIVSPKLAFVSHNFWYLTIFVASTVFTTWNSLTNAALIAYRRTSFVVAINIIFSAVKLGLPFIVHSGGPMTIFAFVGLAQIVNVALSVGVLIEVFGYVPSLKINFTIIRDIIRFGATNYAANALNLLPDSILPLIVIDKLGASAAAYYYVAFTIANLLYQIAFSTNGALLAEASHDELNRLKHIRKGLKFASVLLCLATIAIIVLSSFILGFFGSEYQNGAVTLLRIMCISSLPVLFYSVLNTIFKLVHNLRAILATAGVNAVVIIGLALLLAKPLGLDGIGWSWLIGTIAAVCMGLIFFAHQVKRIEKI